MPINDSNGAVPRTLTVTVSGGVAPSAASVILFDDDELGHGLKQERYVGIAGTWVETLTTHYRYPGSAILGTTANFEASIAPSAGQVLSGYLTPPASGPYVFYLASAHGSELWLSPDESAGKAVRIAEERRANTRRNWAGSGSKAHISAPIQLTQGNWYFVKAVHKAGLGTPHLSVAWQPPGAEPPVAGSAPISGEYLTWALPGGGAGGPGPLRLATSPAGHLLLFLDRPWPQPLASEASRDLKAWTPIWTGTEVQELDVSVLDAGTSHSTMRFYRLRSE